VVAKTAEIFHINPLNNKTSYLTGARPKQALLRRSTKGYGLLETVAENPKIIGFGFLATFFSGLGQTHFIALYSPVLMSHLQLSPTEYGLLYSGITLTSGLIIPFVGPWIDRTNARYFALAITAGLFASELCLLFVDSWVLVAMGLFGLRFLGQGLLSSLSSITIARFFSAQRGQALSLSQMGYPVYEGLITPLGAFVLSGYGHSGLIHLSLAMILTLLLPLAFSLTRGRDDFNHAPGIRAEKLTPSEKTSWTRKEVMRHPTIYLLIPQILMPPFALTGLFFHQATIAEFKGWSLGLMASGLFFFALGRILNTFLMGPLVDRFGAYRLFPFYQLPLALGFLLMSWLTPVWTPALCFGLFGLTVGGADRSSQRSGLSSMEWTTLALLRVSLPPL
jgi:MFS family permease